MRCKLSFLLLSIVWLYSCQSVPKDISYLQEIQKTADQKTEAFDVTRYEPKIKMSDELMITVSAPDLNQEIVAQFNLPNTSFLSVGEKGTEQSATIQTYIVDKNGEITFPVIGKVKIGGLPLSDAIDGLTAKITEYVKNPIVNIKILSFKVSVMGEVLKPGTVSVTNNRISILDALGAVGDLTIYGNRKNVRVVREVGGMPEVATVDLTSTSLFNSPYFYLQQNDVVIVDPNNTRKKDSKTGQSESYKLSVISTVLSTTGLVLSLLTTIILSKK